LQLLIFSSNISNISIDGLSLWLLICHVPDGAPWGGLAFFGGPGEYVACAMR
jgi:hypothetical protein